MSSRTLNRLVSDTQRGLCQKKDAVNQNVENVSNEGADASAKLRVVQPTEALKAFFDRIPLQSVPGIDNVGVIEVQAEQTIEEAMRLLYKHDVLGAPVIDNPRSMEISLTVSDQYVGVVDFGSMILWALEASAGIWITFSKESKDKLSTTDSSGLQNFSDVQSQSRMSHSFNAHP